MLLPPGWHAAYCVVPGFSLPLYSALYYMGPFSYLFSLFKGRNLTGKVGLFPQSYTTSEPPTTVLPSTPSTSADSKNSSVSQGSTLQPLQEESLLANGIQSPSNGHGRELSQGDGEVMKATMTDVQQAIEQLGRNNGSGVQDDARSFSFASSRTGDGDLTDHETDTDVDIEADRETGAGGEDWHRGARMKLAEQARKVVEEKKKQDQDETSVVRNIEPPIEVEMSDESEGEDDEEGHHHHHPPYTREHPYIPEEEEEDEVRHAREETQRHGKGVTQTPAELDLPAPDDSQIPTATPRRAIFSNIRSVTDPSLDDVTSATSLPTPTSPGNPARAIHASEHSVSFTEKHSAQITTNPTTNREALAALPSPAASSTDQPQTSKHSSFASSGPTSSSLRPPSSEQAPSKENLSSKKTTHPSEWTVDDVVDWLKMKGFGEDVSDKFIGKL